MKSEVSQLPQRCGLIQQPILSADVSRRSSVCFRPRNVGMLEQVMSPCAHLQLWFEGSGVSCESTASVSGSYIWGLLCSEWAAAVLLFWRVNWASDLWMWTLIREDAVLNLTWMKTMNTRTLCSEPMLLQFRDGVTHLSIRPPIYSSIYPTTYPFVHPSVCLSVHLSVCSSIHLYQSVYHPSVSPSVYLSVCQSVYLFINPSISVCLPVCPFIHPFIYVSFCHSICPSISSSIYPSIHLSVCLSIYPWRTDGQTDG